MVCNLHPCSLGGVALRVESGVVMMTPTTHTSTIKPPPFEGVERTAMRLANGRYKVTERLRDRRNKNTFQHLEKTYSEQELKANFPEIEI